jgi:ubiquinone/menaquinone biosynthesis C-methylase UbiE/DNA-binding transcriptional ArsR family regulator
MTMFTTADLVTALKAVAEPTRLRILALLRSGPLAVKDLTRILGQSQPRLSRHLKLLGEAGLVERAPEGSWAYFHLAQSSNSESVATQLIAGLDPADPIVARDLQRLAAVKHEREQAAQVYFSQHAAEWDKIRSLHVAEAEVEAAMRAAIGKRPVKLLVDLGTGTGRILELFKDRYARGLGFDLSPAMLSYARSKLDRAGINHAQVRQGDIFSVPLADHTADVVVMHQVLHFMLDPVPAIQEAARLLAPGGTLLIVDFAPHELDFLRETHAHTRLGLADAQVREWLEASALNLGPTKRLRARAADGPDKLTVLVWTATLPENTSTALKRSSSNLEPVA